ncbi:hypothetical protein DUNSADRAFT_8771 [Dunaliella salina]|uniref:F-box domain-containing protein n=1 Tax=Dunaliella salina TaxID=3046 RepID=A0ABQ7GIX6_DUNSA|nr:hypothetical protein DUNSADRAFT_8771 [Dunaliella salina]|eukprot:KAF5834519.1 hypothetical protein DUNSADRAFT_8771 [Dunaliella salina]
MAQEQHPQKQRQEGQQHEAYLPDACVEAVVKNLCGVDTLNARLVCKRWRAIVAPLVHVAILSPRHITGDPEAHGRWLSSTLPGISTLQVVLDANRQPRNLDPAHLESMLHPFTSCTNLNTLSLLFRTSVLPNEGYDEAHFDAYIERWSALSQNLAQGLVAVLPQLGPHLVTLEINAQCNMLSALQSVIPCLPSLIRVKYTLSDHYTVSPDDCLVLGSLKGLQCLAIRSWLPRPFSSDLKEALAQLTKLTSLELEAVSIPPDDSIVEDLEFVANLTELQVLRIKGLGVETLAGLAALSKLKDLTLTLSDNMAAPAWQDLAGLTQMTSLNINAWANYAPTEDVQQLQRVQTLEGLALATPDRPLTHLRSLGIKLGSVRDVRFLARLPALQELIMAFDPCAPAAEQQAPHHQHPHHQQAPIILPGGMAWQGVPADGPFHGLWQGHGLHHHHQGTETQGHGGVGAGNTNTANNTAAALGPGGGVAGVAVAEGGVTVPINAAAGLPGTAGAAAQAAGGTVGGNHNVLASNAAALLSSASSPRPQPVSLHTCLSSLGALTGLRRLDIYDTGGHNIKLTQQMLEDFAQWFPLLLDLYFEGSITCSNLSRASFKRLEHMDLINTLPTPFQANFAQLPPRLMFLGMQNAVLVHHGQVALHNQLQSLSLMKGVIWVDPSLNRDLPSWVASCSKLTSLRIEFSMASWAEQLRMSEGRTPLAALRHAPALQFLDVMYVDSTAGTEGLLDTRLISDLAACPKLEELEVWTRSASDWNEDVSFLPFCSSKTLRSLKLEVMPHLKCLVARELIAEALPACRLRLVANHIGQLLQ